MITQRARDWLLASIFLSAILGAGAAVGAESTFQTLDRIDVYSATGVAEMSFDPPQGATTTGISGANFRACKLTATDGLYCLDGKVVRKWANPAKSSASTTLFSCNDVPGLDSKSADTCTGMTVDLSGDIWLAGKNKGKTHNLVKVKKGTEKPGNGFAPIVDSTDYWAKTVATGRPLLLDISPIDGEVAATFGKTGILGLEERKTVEFFDAETGAASEVASGKSGWGLVGNEQLQSVTLLQPAGTGKNYVLVTTSKGRILSKDYADSAPALQVLGAISAGDTACDTLDPAYVTLDPMYGIRSSSKSGFVYVTDRKGCRVMAFDPTNWNDPKQVLSTGTTFYPEGPTIAPGIGVDLGSCAGECTLIEGAKLSSVSLASEESGLTLFQIKDIPDCRWLHDAPGCDQTITRPDGSVATTIVNADGSYGTPGEGEAATQYLNVTPMLPSEITSLFDKSGEAPSGLPDMLISPQYRGQDCTGGRCVVVTVDPVTKEKTETPVSTPRFYFEAFFGITEPGVVFSGTFEGEFEVAKLAGQQLGCNEKLPVGTPLADLLKWDVVTRVSETYRSVDGKYVDMLLNTGCGSSKGTSLGWSMVSYNLEVTPDTLNDQGDVVTGNDAVFARLVKKLYDDLGDVTARYACTNFDSAESGNSGANAPISGGICSTLLSQWANGDDKLDKCLAATYQPKTSSGNQNCQSFLSQFQNFKDTLSIVGPNGPDPANRKGELEARVKVIQHVYDTRFLPSVPDGGFCEESGTCP
jgi:hypothetical protein